MRLLPAIRHDGQIIVGTPSDSHVTIIEDHNLPRDIADTAHGFTPDGKLWLTRKSALAWLKKYEPMAYRKLRNVPDEGLHSETYAMAKGINQKEPTKGTYYIKINEKDHDKLIEKLHGILEAA